MPRQPPHIPIVHAVAAVPRRALNLDVAVVSLCLVLQQCGLVSFLAFFWAVLVLDDRVNLRRIGCGVLGAVVGVGDWIASCVPPLRIRQAAQAPGEVVEVARAVGEMVDQLLHH